VLLTSDITDMAQMLYMLGEAILSPFSTKSVTHRTQFQATQGLLELSASQS